MATATKTRTTKAAASKTTTRKPAAAAAAAKPAAKTARAAAAKPVAAKGKTTAKAVTGKRTAPAATRAKSAPAAKTAATAIAEKKSWRKDAKVNPKTGFTTGTISDTIAQALLKGGESRKDIVAGIEGLPTETRNGTAFVPSAVVGQVERQMVNMGFRRQASYKLLPPPRAPRA